MNEWFTQTSNALTAISLLIALLTTVIIHYANDIYYHKDTKRRIRRIEKHLGIEENGYE